MEVRKCCKSEMIVFTTSQSCQVQTNVQNDLVLHLNDNCRLGLNIARRTLVHLIMGDWKIASC